MQIIRNKNLKKRIVISSVVAAVLIGGIAAALYIPSSPFALNKKQEDRQENTPDYNPPTDEQKEAGERAKEEFIDRQDEVDKGNVPTQQTDPEATNDRVSISVSSANQNGQTYQIRTTIDGIDTNGVCTLILSKSGTTSVAQEVGTQVLGSYSVCKGFDLATADLQKGSWQANITYKGTLGLGNVSQSVSIQ